MVRKVQSNITLLNTREQILRKKIEKLRSELSFGLAQTKEKRIYKINASSKDQVKNFSLEEHFKTPILGTTNRSTLDDLLEKEVADNNPYLHDAKSLKVYQRLKKYMEELKLIQESTTDISIARHYIADQDKIDQVEKDEEEEDDFYKQMRKEESLFTDAFGFEEEEDLGKKLKSIKNIKFKQVRKK